MFKEVLKEEQPIVYQTLYNALSSDHLSHCYLFVGDKGTGKKNAAYLLAQSLVCEEKDVFACQQCQKWNMSTQTVNDFQNILNEIID